MRKLGEELLQGQRLDVVDSLRTRPEEDDDLALDARQRLAERAQTREVGAIDAARCLDLDAPVLALDAQQLCVGDGLEVDFGVDRRGLRLDRPPRTAA